MAITSNLFKLRSSLVRYETFNELLPTRPNHKPRFSDIDMFHQYRGHRLFIDLKHEKARNKPVPAHLDEMYKVGMRMGQYGVILYGKYIDHYKDTPNYYSEFIPTSATVYSPNKMSIDTYDPISKPWLRRFFSVWYEYVDREENKISERTA